ncbi:nicotinamide riboside kinase 1-like isoform X2 [Etheostoma cragini]|uniref:nicotinamide riboside kinase 1-like isoform X2 n=1 Tax=Etheostoma cragini TaxID=417921 RepID=UPI00155E25CE|nr:nicotinamide riboside kinase 1-like isoform X2 [Etheostoma cragini]
MKTLLVGVGGMTNGGKSTLSKNLHQQIPNSCLIAQDSYFKDDSVVPVDSNGFKQYDMLDALHMDTMMCDVNSWRRDPLSFMRRRGLYPELTTSSADEIVYVLIVEGFLIFNHSLRVYAPPDPPEYFDGHVWQMYLKNRQEMESMVSGIVFLDGMKPKEELLAAVCKEVCQEIEKLRDGDYCSHARNVRKGVLLDSCVTERTTPSVNVSVIPTNSYD